MSIIKGTPMNERDKGITHSKVVDWKNMKTAASFICNKRKFGLGIHSLMLQQKINVLSGKF